MEGDKFALVQLWTINYNDEFRTTFEETTTNPDPGHFKQEAVDNLYRAVVGLFGEEARRQKVKYCTKSTHNSDLTFIGTKVQFELFLEIPGIKESIGVEKSLNGAIQVRTLDKKGNKGSQTFTWGSKDDVEQVLYKRHGFTSFTCVKSREQFEEDCTLNVQIT